MDKDQLYWMVDEVKKGRMSRREFNGRAAALGVAAAGASTLLANAGVAETPMKGGELKVASEYSGAEETYDPTKMTNSTDIQRAYQVYNRLTNLDYSMNLTPNLAENWEARNQATEWIFELREAEFHNGKTLTSADVIYSLSEHIKEGSESPSKPLLAPIIDMQADGPNVVKITLNAGNADFVTTLAHDYHTSIVADGWKDGDPVNGTGPYQVVEYTPGLSSVHKKFANYWSTDTAHVDTVITQGIPDNTARINAVRANDVDIAMDVEPRIAKLLAQETSVEVHSTPSGSWFAWIMAVDRAPTDDLNFRLAMKHAVDRSFVVDNVTHGHGKVGNDFPVNPGLPTYCESIPQHDYDPEKAKWHWDKTGLSSVDLAVSNAAHANALDASIILQEQARAAGIEINLDRVPDDGYWNHTWMQVPFCVTGWNSRPTADAILTIAHACGGSWNETFWCNQRFDDLLVMGRVETDLAKRQEIYCEACTLLHDDGGLFLPFFQNYVEATATRVKNFRGSPAFALGAGWPYEHIWLDDSEA